MAINNWPFHSVVEVGLIGIRQIQIGARLDIPVLNRIGIVVVHTMLDRGFVRIIMGILCTVQG